MALSGWIILLLSRKLQLFRCVSKQTSPASVFGRLGFAHRHVSVICVSARNTCTHTYVLYTQAGRAVQRDWAVCPFPWLLFFFFSGTDGTSSAELSPRRVDVQRMPSIYFWLLSSTCRRGSMMLLPSVFFLALNFRIF